MSKSQLHRRTLPLITTKIGGYQTSSLNHNWRTPDIGYPPFVTIHGMDQAHLAFTIESPTSLAVSNLLERPSSLTIFKLEERNSRAQEIISDYAKLHAGMDIAVGLFGLVPFMAIPALVAAIAAQSPHIYQPMAKRIASVYLATPEELGRGTGEMILKGLVETSALDLAGEFGTEFMMHIAHEIVMEAGLGVVGALCVPVIGGAVGAALDYAIATQMTWRVGTMVSIYYQNGGSWLGSQESTFRRASRMAGSFGKSVTDVINYQKTKSVPRVDLNSIRDDVPAIRQNQLRNLKIIVDLMRTSMNQDQIRASLSNQGVPADLIRDVLRKIPI